MNLRLEEDSGFTFFVLVMAIRMKRALPLEDYEDFIADHPFLFFITNNEGSVIIFLGRYAQPEVAVGVGGHSHEEL